MNVVGNGGYPQVKWTFKGENSDGSVAITSIIPP